MAFSSSSRYILILFTVFCATMMSYAQDKKMTIDGQLALEVGAASGAKVLIEKGGRSVGSANVSGSGDFELSLDFDSDYTLTITQSGFVPVKIRVLTNASSDAKRDGLMPFSMPVYLVQTYPGAPDGSKVMTTVKFDETLYDFDFDKNDYKSLSSQKKLLNAQKAAAVAANKANADAEMKAKQEAIAKRYAEEEAARKKAYEEEERLRKEKELQDKYDAVIAKADKAFAQSEWDFAKQFYQEALGLKAAESYPKTKLTEIETKLAAEKKYQAAMDKGNNALTGKDYTTAKAAFTEALGAKPNDQLAKTKLAEAEAAIAEATKQKELDSKYNTQVAAADKLFVAKKWAEAKTSYNEALKLKPNEEHPKTRIAEADKMIAEEDAKKAAEKEMNDKYNAAVSKADKLFGEKKWNDAKSAYGEASTLKPTEALPKNKIKEIEGIEKAEADKAAKEKELNEKYDAAIVKADGLYSSQKLTEAKTAYSEALALKPTETHPKNKIAEIEKILADEAKKAADEKALNEKFAAAMKKGETALSAKKYSDAKTAYGEAAQLKPSEEEPKAKLKEVEALIAADAAEKAAQDKLAKEYDAAMKKGDTEFANKNYAAAKTAYGEAINLKPGEAAPKTKLKEVETAEKAEADRLAKEKETNEQYAAAVAAADAAFAGSDWLTAKTEYTKASQLKPTENYPKNRLTEIDGKLKSESDQKAAALALDKKYSDAIALGEKQLTAKKYAEAKNAFSDAATLKPTESLPKEKITQIDNILANLAEEAKRKADEEARLAAEEAARKKAEADAQSAADAEAKRKAQEEADAAAARKKAEEEAKAAADAETKRKAQEEAEAAARKKAEEDAAAQKLAAEESARKQAELDAQKAANAAKKAAEDEAKRKAQEDALRLAESEAAAKKLAAEEDAKRKAQESAAKLAEEEAARQRALAEKDAAARKKAEEEAARLAQEDAEKRRLAAEEEERRRAESAQRAAVDQQEQARLLAERKKQLEEAVRLKEEQDRERRKARAMGIVPPVSDGPFVVMYRFTSSTEQEYGYINMGDGTGMRTLSETEYKSLYDKYRDYIRNFYN